MLPRTYPRAIAERTSRNLLQTGAVQGDRGHLTAVLEAAIAEELFLEARLRDEAQALIDANVRKGSMPAGGADIDLLREKIVAKLARDRGRVLR